MGILGGTLSLPGLASAAGKSTNPAVTVRVRVDYENTPEGTLVRRAQAGDEAAFRDIVEGGNAVWRAGPGYDLATGLGTPNADNLLKDLFVAQRLGS